MVSSLYFKLWNLNIKAKDHIENSFADQFLRYVFLFIFFFGGGIFFILFFNYYIIASLSTWISLTI